MNKAKNNFIFKLKITPVIYFLIVTLAMIVFLMPHISFGQVGNPADFDPIPNTPYQPPIFQPEVEAVRPITGDVAVDPSPVDTTGQAHNVSADTNTTVGDSGSFGEIIYDFVVTAVGGIMGLFGSFFDYAVDNFIIGFGDKFKNSGIGFQINKSWGLVRDIFNLTFIFGLVYIGFQMILGSGNSAKSALAHLISAALLVNFSLYITKFVIDFSNLAAAEIFKAFSGRGIGTSFINMLGFSQVLNFNNEAGGSIAWMYIIGLLVMFVVMIYVFAAAAIMITIRFAVLNIYMVASPIMFLGWVFPSMADYSQKYWKGFLGQAFFAPALIFMLYLSYNVTRGYSGLTQASGTELGRIFTPASHPDAPAVFTFFVLTIVFILASLVVAKEMGARGAATAINVGQRMRKGAQGIVTGGLTGLGARATRGSIDKMATSNNKIVRAVGIGLTKYTGVRDAADKAYKSSPQGKWKENRKTRDHALATRTSDARTQQDISTNAVAGGPALESAVRTANQTQLIEALRKHKVGSLGYNHIVGAMTQSQITKLSEAKDDEFSPKERSAVSTTVTGKIVTRITDPATSMIDTTKVPSLTFDELETLGDSWLTNPTNLKLLTNSQVEKLAKDSKVLGTSQKATFKNDWKTALRGVGVISPTTVENAMRGRGPKEIVKLPNELLMDMSAIPYLSESVLKEIAEEKMPQAVLNTIERNMGYPGAEPTGKDYLIRPINKHRDRFW